MTDRIRNAEETDQAAALWLIRREDDAWSAQDEAALAAWLSEAMAHRAAFWRLERGWHEADRVAALGSDNLTSHRRRPVGRWLSAATRFLHPVWAAGLAASLMLIAVGLWSWQPPSAAPISVAAFQTNIGGQRLLTLKDGSMVQLNTATRLRAATDVGAREVWLDEGEAFFDIVHRSDRRFVVHAGPRTITVLGTRFSVRRQGTKVTVAVLSGRVRVDDADVTRESPRTAIVTSGDVAVVEARSTLVTTGGQAEVAALTAWREGMIVFDSTPLSDAAKEFSRYSDRPILVEDPALAAMRVGGVFQTRDRHAFLSLLRRAYGIQVEESATAVLLKR